MSLDISNDMYIMRVAFCEDVGIARDMITAPHVLIRPDLYPDGDMWCALHGEDLATGVAGFGETPEKAMAAFDEAWRSARTPAAMLRSGEAA